MERPTWSEGESEGRRLGRGLGMGEGPHSIGHTPSLLGPLLQSCVPPPRPHVSLGFISHALSPTPGSGEKLNIEIVPML